MKSEALLSSLRKVSSYYKAPLYYFGCILVADMLSRNIILQLYVLQSKRNKDTWTWNAFFKIRILMNDQGRILYFFLSLLFLNSLLENKSLSTQ